MSRQTHLDRGYCCDRGCVYCPWRQPIAPPPYVEDPRVLAALLSGVPTTIYSDRQSLQERAVIANVTIIYKPYKTKIKDATLTIDSHS